MPGHSPHHEGGNLPSVRAVGHVSVHQQCIRRMSYLCGCLLVNWSTNMILLELADFSSKGGQLLEHKRSMNP